MNYVEIKMKEMLIKKLKSMDSGSDSCKMLQELNQFSSFKNSRRIESDIKGANSEGWSGQL